MIIFNTYRKDITQNLMSIYYKNADQVEIEENFGDIVFVL